MGRVRPDKKKNVFFSFLMFFDGFLLVPDGFLFVISGPGRAFDGGTQPEGRFGPYLIWVGSGL